MTMQEQVELLRETVALWVEVYGPDQAPEPRVMMRDGPAYAVRCGQCGAEYSYALGCCTGCGRN
jgi:hypothetical protein